MEGNHSNIYHGSMNTVYLIKQYFRLKESAEPEVLDGDTEQGMQVSKESGCPFGWEQEANGFSMFSHFISSSNYRLFQCFQRVTSYSYRFAGAVGV